MGNPRLLSLVYSAADVFAIPSLLDNSPNTVLEAMACGLPVAGFSVGGIADMVRPGTSGLLAPRGDVGRLGHAVLELLDGAPLCLEMGRNGRRIALEEYSSKLQAERFAELYAELLGDP